MSTSNKSCRREVIEATQFCLGFVAIALIASLPGLALANDGTCDDPSLGQPDLGYVTCVPLTESTLEGLEDASKSAIRRLMQEPGRPADDDGTGLHYDSDDPNFGGVVNFSFKQNQVSVIDAIITTAEGQNLNFTWNAAGYFCSDLPTSDNLCSGPNANPITSPAFQEQMNNELNEVNQ